MLVFGIVTIIALIGFSIFGVALACKALNTSIEVNEHDEV